MLARQELFAGVFLPGRGLAFFGLKPFSTMAYWAFCLLRRGLLFGRRRVAPGGLIVALTPCAGTIEGMHTELVDLLHLVDPVGPHPVRVVVRGLRYLRHPQLAVEHVARDAFGALPRFGFGDDVGDAVTGESKLTRVVPVRVLVDDAADVVRIEWREDAVHYDLRHRDLPAHRFAARFKIDGIGETLFSLRTRNPGQRQPLGGRVGPLVGAGHLTLAGNALPGSAFVFRRHRRQRRLFDVRIA